MAGRAITPIRGPGKDVSRRLFAHDPEKLQTLSDEIMRHFKSTLGSRSRVRSTGCLAATGTADLAAQRIETDRADHHVITHHITRRAVEAERLGELEALFQREADLVARQVLFKSGHVHPDLLGDGERARLVDLTAAAEQLLMEVEV